MEAHLGSESFELQAERVGDDWFVAAQSLANVDRIESDLLLLEVIAGPILLVAVFFGTLLIGVKAASPVELARRRQLEFTADASHELRTPLSVIEAEVTLSLQGSRSGDDYRATLERIGRESLRLRDIVEDLLWLARFDSEPPPPGDEPVDVAAIAAACADRFSAVAQRDGILLCWCGTRARVRRGSTPHPSGSTDWLQYWWTMPVATPDPGEPCGSP